VDDVVFTTLYKSYFVGFLVIRFLHSFEYLFVIALCDDKLLIAMLSCLRHVKAYENIKCRSKKAVANDRVERMRTGGGTFVSQLDAVDEKVVSLLGNRAQPLNNNFDSDAAYCNATGTFIIYNMLYNFKKQLFLF